MNEVLGLQALGHEFDTALMQEARHHAAFVIEIAEEIEIGRKQGSMASQPA